MFNLLVVLTGIIVTLLVPGTRIEYRNTRPYESPLRACPPLHPFDPVCDTIPDSIPIPGLAYGGAVSKRYVPAGQGQLTAARTGPLAWVWADLGPEFPARRAAGPWATAMTLSGELWGRVA